MKDNEEFRARTALVTGASRGIGAETAVALASRGAFTLVHYNTHADQACAVLERIRAAGGDGALVKADLSHSDGIRLLLDQIQLDPRPIDILVNNAGSLVRRVPFLYLG